ncbi:MAG: ATP-binding protein [Bacteroidales bacterium]|nr:ATP-binding protein [Bacteroidales bacterium]
MKELAMHVYDLMENSTAANAKDVKLTIVDSLANNDFHFTIEDNGKGMSPEFLARVTDPYTTSRTTRKVGLGLPLIKMNTEKCGGGMKLTSEVGVGTRLEFWFEHNHWDRPPMGDLPGTLVMLLSAHEDIHFVITYRTDVDEFVLDTDELKEALDGMSMNDIHIINYLKEMIAENLKEIKANE